MKQASEAGDISEEVTAPQVRDWFQPLSRTPAASGADPADDVTRPPTHAGAFRPALSRPPVESPDPQPDGAPQRDLEGADRGDPGPGFGEPRPDAGGKRLRVFDSSARASVSAPQVGPVGPVGAAADIGDAPADKQASKRSRSVFGPAPTSRPDMLTDAETVIMPSLKGPKGTTEGSKGATAGQPAADKAEIKPSPAGVQNGGTSGPQPVTTMTPIRSSAEFAEAVTQMLPTLEPPKVSPDAGTVPERKHRRQDRKARRAFPPAERYTPGRRTTLISRLILLAIVCLQAVLSLRLRNTAFEDEATYLYAGHMELEHILHGSPLQGNYASYFSGSPVLYPVLGAAVDQAGGLALARALSLVEMLGITALLYSLTRRLFNERIGLCAAGFFAVTESAIFLGNFATYDATCLFLLAFAAWIMVRTASFRWPVFLLAALPAALAVGVKYAGLLFVPTIAVLPVLTGWPERGRRVLWYPLAFGAAVAGLLLAALRLGGQAYTTALQSTTTNRAQGTTPVSTILRESAEWGGVLFVLAVIGTIAYIWRVRTEPDEKIAPAGGRFRRAALGVVLTGTALLAPTDQAHLHTDISFLKHIGFGLFFAAPMAGVGLARIMGDYFRRPQFGVAAWSLALVLGMVQSNQLYHSWPSSGPFVSTFAKYLKPHARYLVEVPEVPIYYLMGRPDAQPDQFTSTFVITYFNKKGQELTGPAGFTAAVQDGYFQVIAYNNDVTLAVDGALAKALQASHSYYLAAKVNLSDTFGPVVYSIWVKGHKPTPRTSTAKVKKSSTG
jgi:hypothetical protein